ncbi:MAG: class I SAM-dependent methyltransferase [Planctomycetota bacterium]
MSRTFEEHADLYDLAFSWDTEEDAEWLLDRLGRSSKVLLEPGCGSGRMFPALARRGVSLVGVDRSETMLDRARRRMRAEGLPEPTLVCGDMADFHLDLRVDGAYCPIGTLGYLTTPGRAVAHLACVARHLRPGARYLVQIDLNGLIDHRLSPPDEHSRWEMDAPEGRIRCSCFGTAWDATSRIETQVCRFEVLTGARQGEVYEDMDDVLLWDWPAWSSLIDRSPFRQTAAYEGRKIGGRQPVEVGPALEGVRLVWHELVLS